MFIPRYIFMLSSRQTRIGTRMKLSTHTHTQGRIRKFSITVLKRFSHELSEPFDVQTFAHMKPHTNTVSGLQSAERNISKYPVSSLAARNIEEKTSQVHEIFLHFSHPETVLNISSFAIR